MQRKKAFLRAYSRLAQYNPEMKFSTWLFSIANHHCIDRLRKRRVTYISIEDNPVLQNLEGDMVLPESYALRSEQSADMQLLIGQLDPDYRTPLVLRYWEEMSYEEIATAMGLTIAAVKSRLFRARQQLAALYADREAATTPPSSGVKAKRQARESRNDRDHVLHMRLSWAGI